MTTRCTTTPLLRGAAFAALASVLPGLALGQETTVPAPTEMAPETMPDATSTLSWQEAITGQIVAFRNGDAGGAFSYAGEAFHAGFPSAEAFFVTIMGSGYAPIMQSRSHSFGSHEQIDAETVAQVVRFVGNDQMIYEAIYLLGREESGWRVHGVQLQQAAGIGI